MRPPYRTTLLITLVLLISILSFAFAQEQELDNTIYEQFDQVSALNSQGEYGHAIDILNSIIQEYGDSDTIIQRAYNTLVYTLLTADRTTEARGKARAALLRYPDLRVDEAYAPKSIDNLYNELRANMFGSLSISKPESCRVFMNDDYMGSTPLYIEYIRRGTYELEMLKSGYHTYLDTLQVVANDSENYNFTMDRDRSRSWWLKRIGAGVVAGTIAAFLLIDESATPAEPLPGPPDIPPK